MAPPRKAKRTVRLSHAAAWAGATTYGSIKSILQNGLDKAYANSNAPDGPPIRHANIRGRGYYH